MRNIFLSLCVLLLLVACGVPPAPDHHLYNAYSSPDGVWSFEVIYYDDCVIPGGENEVYEELKLVQVSSGDERIADEQIKTCGGLGAFGFEGLFWSPNSHYFYYTDAREGVPDGCGYWERPIIRMDVTTLNKEPIGEGPRSPDGLKVATWQGQELVVWDVNDGEITRFPVIFPEAQIGPITWSPDSRALVYIKVASWCPLSGKSYLAMVDLTLPEQRLLLESEKHNFSRATWEVAGELSLLDENGQEWRYDLVTQELVPMP